MANATNPVVTYHRVQLLLAQSEWPSMKELVIRTHTGAMPGIVLSPADVEALAALFAHAAEKNRAAGLSKPGAGGGPPNT